MHASRSTPPARESQVAGTAHRRGPHPIVLWQLRGAVQELRSLAIETAFGYALAFEVDGELVWLDVQPSLEYLVTLADHMHARLLTRGWRVLPVERVSSLHD